MKLCVDCIHVSVCFRQGTVDLNYADKCGDYEPSRRKGHWIRRFDLGNCLHYICSKCENEGENSDYCPNCGAEMEISE